MACQVHLHQALGEACLLEDKGKVNANEMILRALRVMTLLLVGLVGKNKAGLTLCQSGLSIVAMPEGPPTRRRPVLPILGKSIPYKNRSVNPIIGSLAEQLDHDGALARTGIELKERDLLPGTQAQLSTLERDT